MTTPLGYPDYVRTFATSRQLLFLDFNVTFGAVQVSGAINTGNTHSIGIRSVNSANHLRITIDWFLDSALTALITSDVIDTRQSIPFDQTVTVKGPFARVTRTPFGGASSTWSLLIYEAPYESVTQQAPTANLIMAANGTNVAASTTITQDSNRVWAGPATLTMFFTTTTSWDMTLFSLQADGTLIALARADDTHIINCQNIYLPTTPLRISVHNGDGGAAHFAFFFLAGKPLYP